MGSGLPGEPEDHASAAPAFPELVWLHHRWDLARRNGGAEVDQRYDDYVRARVAFEQDQGRIVEEYWCSHEASASVVTIEPPEGRFRRLKDPSVRFHRVSDWETSRWASIADTLHLCDTLAIKARAVLRGPSEIIAITWIQAVAAHLLGFIEREGDSVNPARDKQAALHQRAELVQIEKYYARAGNKAGRLVYVLGLVVGLLGLAALVGLLSFVLWKFHALDSSTRNMRYVIACYAAGALGASVSVLTRMASAQEGRFTVDYEIGRVPLALLGSLRPFLGGIFGVVAYFALKGELVQFKPPKDATSFFYYAALAFVAGFSERFVQVILGGAQRMFGTEDSAAGALKPPPATTREPSPSS